MKRIKQILNPWILHGTESQSTSILLLFKMICNSGKQLLKYHLSGLSITCLNAWKVAGLYMRLYTQMFSIAHTMPFRYRRLLFVQTKLTTTVDLKKSFQKIISFIPLANTRLTHIILSIAEMLLPFWRSFQKVVFCLCLSLTFCYANWVEPYTHTTRITKSHIQNGRKLKRRIAFGKTALIQNNYINFDGKHVKLLKCHKIIITGHHIIGYRAYLLTRIHNLTFLSVNLFYFCGVYLLLLFLYFLKINCVW